MRSLTFAGHVTPGSRPTTRVVLVDEDTQERFYGFGDSPTEALRDAEEQREDVRESRARVVAKAHRLLMGGTLP